MKNLKLAAKLVRETERERYRTYITVKAAKVNETRVGELSSLPVVNTQEKVQCEAGDHRSKELDQKQSRMRGSSS